MSPLESARTLRSNLPASPFAGLQTYFGLLGVKYDDKLSVDNSVYMEVYRAALLVSCTVAGGAK